MVGVFIGYDQSYALERHLCTTSSHPKSIPPGEETDRPSDSIQASKEQFVVVVARHLFRNVTMAVKEMTANPRPTCTPIFETFVNAGTDLRTILSKLALISESFVEAGTNPRIILSKLTDIQILCQSRYRSPNHFVEAGTDLSHQHAAALS